MRKIFLIVIMLVASIGYSQKHKVDVVVYKELTTAQRDAYVVPSGERWTIFNLTTDQFQQWDGDSWEAFGANPDLSNYVTLDGIETISGQKTFSYFLNYFGDPNSSHVRIYDSPSIENHHSSGAWSALRHDQLIFHNATSSRSLLLKPPSTQTGNYDVFLQDKAGTVAYLDDINALGSIEGIAASGTGATLINTIGLASNEANIVIDANNDDIYLNASNSVIVSEGLQILNNGLTISNGNIEFSNGGEIEGLSSLPYSVAWDGSATPALRSELWSYLEMLSASSSNLPGSTLTESRFLTEADNGKLLVYSGSTDIQLTRPLETTTSLPLYFNYRVIATGIGKIQVINEDPSIVGRTVESDLTDENNLSFIDFKTETNTWVTQGTANNFVYSPPSDPVDLSGLVFRVNQTSIDATAVTDGDDADLWTDIINGNNGTNIDTASPSLNIFSSERQVSFDGIEDYLDFNTPIELDFAPGVDEFTIAVQIGETAPTTGYFICKAANDSGSASNRQYALGIDGSGNIVTYVGGVSNNTTSGTVTLASDDWLIMTVSTTNVTVTHNDVEIINSNTIGSATTSGDIIVGARTAGTAFFLNGDIAEIPIYNRVLTASEITAINN